MDPQVRIGIFIVATLGLIYVSRASLMKPRAHGFFRFFAWEAIIGLALVNVPVWFRDWLSWNQILSWLLLFVSFVPLGLGLNGLRRFGGRRDAGERPGGELYTFERTTRLVSDGVFRYIRHPLYCSLLLLAWGIFLKAPTPVGTALAAAASLSLVFTARADERECLEAFGEEYRSYMRHTKMFIPYVV